jgi:hypothetical protein
MFQKYLNSVKDMYEFKRQRASQLLPNLYTTLVPQDMLRQPGSLDLT